MITKIRKLDLHWSDLMNLWLWNHFANRELVTDDQAFTAALRVREFVERAIEVLTGSQSSVDEEPEEK